MELAQLQTMAVLESNAMESRYHQATMALLIRICIVFLGFLTGMVLALVGAAFILGKLRDPSSNLNAQAAMWKVSLTTASPGLVLVLLGTTLMLATIMARIDVECNGCRALPLLRQPECEADGNHQYPDCSRGKYHSAVGQTGKTVRHIKRRSRMENGNDDHSLAKRLAVVQARFLKALLLAALALCVNSASAKTTWNGSGSNGVRIITKR